MHVQRRSEMSFDSGFPLVLLSTMLGILWLAGGAARPDVYGQVIVRTAAWLLLVTALIFAERPATWGVRPVLLVLLAALCVAIVQLIPLPPGIWQSLPGREPFERAAVLMGQDQPWRPLAIVPGAAYNAASALVVPAVILFLLAGVGERGGAWLPAVILGLIAASALLGLTQFSGVIINNPLINDTPGQVSGTFANRNHFALFMALGCLIAPVWALAHDGERQIWRMVAALGLMLVFVLTILATGSRAGVLVGALGVGIGLALVQRGMRKALGRGPRWAFPALIGGVVAVLAIVVLLSVVADRAVSIRRILAVDAGQDMRQRGLPVVWAMIREYFPVGAGFGGFDPLFRMHEPFALLKLTYFNHAHNDFLEIVLDAGLPGLLILVAAIGWWGWASIKAWRSKDRAARMLARLGSAMILLVLVASIFDYPARTPMIMAMLVVAAVWLARGTHPAKKEP